MLRALIVLLAQESHLPLEVGQGWVLKDKKGEVTIRVAAAEKFADRDCFRVDWETDGKAYQSEFWAKSPEGILAVGRRFAGRDLAFSKPYLLLRDPLKAGDSWTASIVMGAAKQDLQMTVGPEEEVAVPAGKYRAMRVVFKGDAVEYRRWYARGVGLVREDVLAVVKGELRVLGEKTLVRRLK